MPELGNGNGGTFSNKQLWEWIYRAAVLIVILWAQNNFVGKAEYAEDKKVMIEINQILARIDERSKLDTTKDRLSKLEQDVATIKERFPVRPTPPTP